MIAVARTAEPTVLRKHSARWLTELKSVMADPNATRARHSKALRRYQHREIKESLVKMFHGKCAYCESLITVVTYGAIEHFYPKAHYVDKTFEWKNLLLSCDKCNDAEHKGDRFLLSDNGHPMLLDPTDEGTDIARHLDFVWDHEARMASVYGRDERGRLVEEVFDLNGVRGRKELIRHRSDCVKKLLVLCTYARENDQEALALLGEACQPNAEYSAFAVSLYSSFLNGEKLSPSLL